MVLTEKKVIGLGWQRGVVGGQRGDPFVARPVVWLMRGWVGKESVALGGQLSLC